MFLILIFALFLPQSEAMEGIHVDYQLYKFMACIDIQGTFYTGVFVLYDRILTNIGIEEDEGEAVIRPGWCFNKRSIRVVEYSEHYEYTVSGNTNMRFVILRTEKRFKNSEIEIIRIAVMNFPLYFAPTYGLSYSRSKLDKTRGWLRIYHMPAIRSCDEKLTDAYFNETNVCWPGNQPMGADYWDMGVYGQPLIWDAANQRRYIVGIIRNLYYEYPMTVYTTFAYADPYLRVLVPGMQIEYFTSEGSIIKRKKQMRSEAARLKCTQILLVTVNLVCLCSFTAS